MLLQKKNKYDIGKVPIRKIANNELAQSKSCKDEMLLGAVSRDFFVYILAALSTRSRISPRTMEKEAF